MTRTWLFQRQATKDFTERVEEINCGILKHFYKDSTNHDITPVVPPPLGRLIAEPALDYMEVLLHYKDVNQQFEHLKALVNDQKSNNE